MCSLLAKVMFCLYLSHLTRLSIPLTYPTPLPPNVEQSAAPLFHSEIKRRKEKETQLEQVSCVETCVQGTLTYCIMQTKGESESEIGMGGGGGGGRGRGRARVFWTIP
jgi:hypothetical protein